jgi:Glycosyltransferase family 9 (heptosyltransferase)
MKLLQSYSRSCSVPINNKPFIYEKYFALPDNITKYITIQTKSGMSSKDYSYWDEVISILKPYLDKENIKILHIGQDSLPLNHTINLNNQTNIGQSYYIIKNSLLHLSIDSWSVHAACAENVPCVALYGSTTIDNHSPYHFNPDKSIFLESNRNGKKASFAREENPKTVDLITPERIVEAVCKLLNIEFDYPYKTIYIGKSFQNKMLESDCTGIINTQQIGVQALIMRLDYNFNLAILEQQMNICKVSIITSAPIPINLLIHYKNQIIEVIYKIDKNHNPDFAKQLIENKIKFNMFSELSEDELNSIKLEYIDYGIIHQRKWMEMPIELKDKHLNNIYYKSSKITISKSGIYQSKWGLDNGFKISTLLSEIQKLEEKDLDKLFRESEYVLFLEKAS